VRLARGSFEEFITGAWRSAAAAGPASCGMPPCFCVWWWAGGLARCSVEEVITGRCMWIWAFLHLGIRIRTSIWGFLTEQTRLLAAVVVAPPPPCGGSVRWRGGAGGLALKTASPCAGGATRGDGCSDEG
jgi:hypothetical protein